MVDKALVLRKIAELEEYLSQINEYQKVTVQQYEGDWKLQRIVERTLQMMIETCVDIAGHIISDQQHRIPKSYAESFRVLAEEKMLGESLSQSMERMAKFRNIVVHHYDRVDAHIVVRILKKHLEDFLDYKKAILLILKQNN